MLQAAAVDHQPLESIHQVLALAQAVQELRIQ
jgi:hypothetical protein